jgi:hypothetical protein
VSASRWRQYVIESDELAEGARRHAQATREHHRQLIELYGKPAKTHEDWSMISQLIVSTRAGYDAASTLATLAGRAAQIADTLERNENR